MEQSPKPSPTTRLEHQQASLHKRVTFSYDHIQVSEMYVLMLQEEQASKKKHGVISSSVSRMKNKLHTFAGGCLLQAN